MRHEIIDREHLPQRDRQVHELLQINRLGALQFREQSNHPEEKEKGRDDKPDHHDYRRHRVVQAKDAAEQRAHEANRAQHERARADENRNYRAESAAAPPLI